MAKILVCGGTGFVGSHIVHALLPHHQVRILTRSLKKRKPIPQVELVEGNLLDLNSLQNAMKDCDVVINAAQFDNAPFENPSKGQTYEKVDAEGTENIVRAIIHMRIPRVLYVSGAGVDEQKTEPWFRAKVRAERAIRNSGAQWTIFRPSWIYGKGDRSLNRMIPMIRYSPFVFILGSGYQIQPVYINDVAQIVAKAVQEPKSQGKIYELGGPEKLTMKEILGVVAKVLKRRRLYVTIPKILAAPLFSFLEKVPGVPVTRAALDFITMNVTIPAEEIQKTQNDFELRFSTLEKGLQEYLS